MSGTRPSVLRGVVAAGFVAVGAILGGAAPSVASAGPGRAASATTAEPPAERVVAPVADSGPPAGANRALELHDEARQLYVEGRYRAAIDKLEQALELDPDEKDLHYITAFVAEKLGEFDLALEYYRACGRLEKDPEELNRLTSIIQRLEGARLHAGFHPVPDEPSPPPVAAPAAAPRESTVDFGPWPYVTAAVAGSALLVGGMLAAHALTVDPGSDVMTSPGVSVDDLREDARAAHTTAIAADVAFTVAGLTGALALALVIIEQVHRADRVDRRRERSGLTVQPDGQLSLRF